MNLKTLLVLERPQEKFVTETGSVRMGNVSVMIAFLVKIVVRFVVRTIAAKMVYVGQMVFAHAIMITGVPLVPIWSLARIIAAVLMLLLVVSALRVFAVATLDLEVPHVQFLTAQHIMAPLVMDTVRAIRPICSAAVSRASCPLPAPRQLRSAPALA